MKKSLLLLFLCAMTSTVFGQQLEEVDLGTIKGELSTYHGSTSWTHTGTDTIRGDLWTDQSWMKLNEEGFVAIPGEPLTLDYKIDLTGLVGIQQAEVRLLDEEGIIVHGFLFSARFQGPDTAALDTYRNDYFPFKSKEQVFNLGAGFTNQTLQKEFVVYNFGGDSLHLDDLTTSVAGLSVTFSPESIAHNQFTRMYLSLSAPEQVTPGFVRKGVELLSPEGKVVSVIPVQYSLEDYPSMQGGGASMAVSKVNHDFKVIKTDEIRETTVTISNVGSKDLEIKNIESNCDCLRYTLDQTTIGPNSSTQLKVTFDASERIGYERKTLAIFSNDAQKPTRVLVFRAHVK